MPVAFYFNAAWSTRDALASRGINLDTLSDAKKNLLKSHGFEIGEYDSTMPRMVYMTEKDWSKSNQKENLPVKTPKNEFILSNSTIVNKVALEYQGINSTTAILCLAASGLDLILPNLSFELVAKEEVDRIKNTLAEERTEYINAITRIADESFERLKSGDLKDILQWSKNEINFKVMPKARIVEQNITKISATELRKSGFSYWKEKIPLIGRAYFESGIAGASKLAGEKLLEFIVKVLAEKEEKRLLPEVSYIFRVEDLMEAHGSRAESK